MDFSHLQLSQIDIRLLAQAAQTREDSYALLDRLSVISRPGTLENTLLVFFSRLAMRTWIDGDLQLEIRILGEDECQIRLLCDMGDIFEVLKKVTLCASFEQFRQAGSRTKGILPFRLVKADLEKLTFYASISLRKSTIPPPSELETALIGAPRPAPLPSDMSAGIVHALVAPEPAVLPVFPPEEPTTTRLARVALVKKPALRGHPPSPAVAAALEKAKARKRTRPYGQTETPDPASQRSAPPDSCPQPPSPTDSIDEGWDDDQT